MLQWRQRHVHPLAVIRERRPERRLDEADGLGPDVDVPILARVPHQQSVALLWFVHAEQLTGLDAVNRALNRTRRWPELGPQVCRYPERLERRIAGRTGRAGRGRTLVRGGGASFFWTRGGRPRDQRERECTCSGRTGGRSQKESS